MSTIVFNDASELSIQDVKCLGDYLMIKSLVASAQLRAMFEDPVKTRKIQIKERGQIIAEYEGYTQFYRVEEYIGQIYGVTMYRPERTPEAQQDVQRAAILVAQIQAQSLTDDQAVQVKSIYPAWSPDGVHYPVDYKVLHNDVLYKSLQDHTSQADWAPGVAPSIWVAVDSGEHAGTQDDPIPVPDTVETAGMEYEKGKYYQEGDTVYLMIWPGIQEGEKLTLYFPPSKLEAYFQVVETE